MRTQEFMKQLQLEAISVAIRAAELRTSGEIRVFVSRKQVDAPVTAAQAEFVRMGMSQTREKNAVLIFVAPAAQTFAVVGDTGVHAKCGDAFWLELADAMTKHFQKSEFTEGILQGVHKAGELLAKHFPRGSDDRNELSDQVEHD